MIECNHCKSPYPSSQTPYRCPDCGGVYDFSDPPIFNLDEINFELPGIWRYRHTLFLPGGAPIVYLGEGQTPLVWCEVFEYKVAFKLEFLNPTGSFKDRGTAPLVSFLLSRGVTSAVEDSSGNAGASFAAYASAVGIGAKIFIPVYASGPKRAQIEAYGAEVVRVNGPRWKSTEAVELAAQNGAVYASHTYMPHDILGYATIAYELYEELGEAPGTVIAPVGQGSLLLGIGWGFAALQRSAIIERTPMLIGVQAAACAPLWTGFTQGVNNIDLVVENETVAEGVRTRYPLRAESVIQLVRSTQGRILIVEEKNILPGRDQLASRGLFVEPTSAIVWDGLSQIIGQAPEPIIVILTGSGLKNYP